MLDFDDCEFRITELGVDADEEKLGVQQVYVIRRDNLSIALLECYDGIKAIAFANGFDAIVARGRARERAKEWLQRKRASLGEANIRVSAAE